MRFANRHHCLRGVSTVAPSQHNCPTKPCHPLPRVRWYVPDTSRTPAPGLRLVVNSGANNQPQDHCALPIPELHGTQVRHRIILGTFSLSAGYSDKYYKRAQEIRAGLSRDFAKVFEHLDVLICPTAPTTAYR